MLYIINIITYRTLSLFVYKQLLISLIYGKSKIETKYITTTTKPHAVFNYKVCFSRSNLISISQLWIVSIKNVKTESVMLTKEAIHCHQLDVHYLLSSDGIYPPVLVSFVEEGPNLLQTTFTASVHGDGLITLLIPCQCSAWIHTGFRFKLAVIEYWYRN